MLARELEQVVEHAVPDAPDAGRRVLPSVGAGWCARGRSINRHVLTSSQHHRTPTIHQCICEDERTLRSRFTFVRKSSSAVWYFPLSAPACVRTYVCQGPKGVRRHMDHHHLHIIQTPPANPSNAQRTSLISQGLRKSAKNFWETSITTCNPGRHAKASKESVVGGKSCGSLMGRAPLWLGWLGCGGEVCVG